MLGPAVLRALGLAIPMVMGPLLLLLAAVPHSAAWDGRAAAALFVLLHRRWEIVSNKSLVS